MCPDEPRVTSAFSEYRLTSMQASVTELLESVVNLEFRLRNLKEDASKLEVNIYSEVLDLQDGLDRVRASGNKVGAEVSALQAGCAFSRECTCAHVWRDDFCLGDFGFAGPLYAANALGSALLFLLHAVRLLHETAHLS